MFINVYLDCVMLKFEYMVIDNYLDGVILIY